MSLFLCEEYLQQQHINATISYYISSQSDKWQTSASQIFREGGEVQGLVMGDCVFLDLAERLAEKDDWGKTEKKNVCVLHVCMCTRQYFWEENK